MTATAKDRFILDQLSYATAAVRAEVYGPLAPFKETLNPTFDSTAYAKVISDMKATLRSATRQQWHIIQEARAWEQVMMLGLDWFEFRFTLLKLEFAGLARRFHIVGIVDVQRTYAELRGLEGRSNG